MVRRRSPQVLDFGFGKKTEIARERKTVSKKPRESVWVLIRQSKIQNRRVDGWNRREFLSAAALAGTGAVLGLLTDGITAEPPLETTKLRLAQTPTICQ